MRATCGRSLTALLVAMLLTATLSGCSLKTVAIRGVANSLARSGDTFGSDDDPELVRAAVPFSLKLVESLLAELPHHRGLLLTACAGFTQYAYAFVEHEAELVRDRDYTAFVRLQDRARRLYLRGRDYCLRSLDLKFRGIRNRLSADRHAALAAATAEDVPLLYWTTASWGRAVAISLDQPALIADLPVVQSLARRALELDEDFNAGALHEVMIALEALPEAMGGSPVRARLHFERAIALSEGASAGAYVSFARSVVLPQQRRREFAHLLNQALSVDVHRVPRLRLANILAQRQARLLLDDIENLFLEGAGEARSRDETGVHR